MTRRFTLFLLLVSLTLLRSALVFPTWEDMTHINQWSQNSSGDTTISYDQAEQAIKFSLTFTDIEDKWAYPKFTAVKGQTFNGITSVSFDMKVLPQATRITYKTANVLCSTFTAFEPPVPGEWHHYTCSLPDADRSDSTFSIGVNPHNRTYAYLIKNITFTGKPREKVIPPSLLSTAPGGVFFEKAPLTFTCNTSLKGLRATVKNWRGKTMQETAWPQEGKDVLTLSPLPLGYYVLSVTSDTPEKLRDFTFTIVPDPAKRIMDKNSFFAMDTAQSWVARRGNFNCPWYDGDTFRLVSDLCAWAGLPHVRERLSWGSVQSQAKVQPNYDHYMYNAKLLKERGILISGMYHDSPAWSDRITKLPRDLVAVYDFAKQAATDFGDCMGDWEFWNEQDIGFAPEPVWDYAPAMKAASLGFHAANPQLLVTNGAICRGAGAIYTQRMFDNDIAPYINFYNFHTYSPASAYRSIYQANHELLARYGIADYAIWCTESGTNLEGNSTNDGVRKGLKAHTPEQELVFTECYPKSQIAHMMNGGSRNYYFVFPPFNERNGTKDWGIMRRDGTVKPAYAALSTMTAHLVSAKIAGEITVNDNVKVYLFNQPDGFQTIVFWSVSAVDTFRGGIVKITSDHEQTFELPLPAGTYPLSDMVGTPSTLTVPASGKAVLASIRYPQYIGGLRGLKADIPAIPTGNIHYYTPKADEDLAVIIRADIHRDDFSIGGDKTVAELKGTSGRMRLQIWNLDDTAKTGHLAVTGGQLEGLPASISLPPRGKAEFDVVLKPEYKSAKFTSDLIINGIFNGKKSTRFLMPVHCLGLFLANCRILPLNVEDPMKWRRNDSSDTMAATYDEAEKAIRFDVIWEKDVDRWFYPEYLLKLPQETLKSAHFIQFEVKTTQDKVENDFKTACVMLVEGDEHQGGKAIHLRYPAPNKNWEMRRVRISGRDAIDLDAVKQLRIGANPQGKRMTFWLRNATILYEK